MILLNSILFFCFFLLHLVAVHIFKSIFKYNLNPQIFYIKFSIFFIVVSFTFFLLLKVDIDTILFYEFNNILFIYSYFHILNMSETARRIEMLISIKNNNFNVKKYNSNLMIKNRIERLKKFSWIVQNRNNFQINCKYPLYVAYLFKFLRKILFYKKL